MKEEKCSWTSRSHSRPTPAQYIERVAVEDFNSRGSIARFNRFHQIWGLRIILTVFNGLNEAVKIGTDRNVVVGPGPRLDAINRIEEKLESIRTADLLVRLPQPVRIEDNADHALGSGDLQDCILA